MNKLTTEDWIFKAILVHGLLYDYSLVIYERWDIKIKIICHKHGIFEQTPNAHTNGQGCPTCGKERISNILMLSLEDFLLKSNITHNYFYDYSLTNYTGIFNKINIICPLHGIFEQIPHNHLKGCGCPKCKGYKIATLCSSNVIEFIEKSIKIHGYIYNYDNVIYVNSKTKVCIICKTHGEFNQTPSDHLQGKGCPKCKISYGEKKILNWLESNNITYKHEHRFNNCKNILPLPFDFYIPDYNMCIEFDGLQHYIPHSFGSDKSENVKNSNLLKIKNRDIIKNEFCIKNEIHLLRIPYHHFDFIEYILHNTFRNN